MKYLNSLLVLQDGTYFEGIAFGAEGEALGEVVFNTAMTGYQEILTDPSYNGQMVAMTYPLIGNCGFNGEDVESAKPWVRGFIVKELCEYPSNWRCTLTPQEYFQKNNIVGIMDVDTRQLTHHLRNHGSLYGIISTSCKDVLSLAAKAQRFSLNKYNLVAQVSTEKLKHIMGKGPRIVLLDLGVKKSILCLLKKMDCEVYIMPWNTTSREIMALNPDGILLSNGPGDPAGLEEVIKTVSEIIGYKPILGLCLGHQILGIALGGRTYKLKFGHHGAGHPVKNLKNNRIYITSQNHSYALDDNISSDIIITHRNINDQTVEGFIHRNYPIIGLQFHPENPSDPLETGNEFQEFMDYVSNATS